MLAYVVECCIMLLSAAFEQRCPVTEDNRQIEAVVCQNPTGHIERLERKVDRLADELV